VNAAASCTKAVAASAGLAVSASSSVAKATSSARCQGIILRGALGGWTPAASRRRSQGMTFSSVVVGHRVSLAAVIGGRTARPCVASQMPNHTASKRANRSATRAAPSQASTWAPTRCCSSVGSLMSSKASSVSVSMTR